MQSHPRNSSLGVRVYSPGKQTLNYENSPGSNTNGHASDKLDKYYGFKHILELPVCLQKGAYGILCSLKGPLIYFLKENSCVGRDGCRSVVQSPTLKADSPGFNLFILWFKKKINVPHWSISWCQPKLINLSQEAGIIKQILYFNLSFCLSQDGKQQ